MVTTKVKPSYLHLLFIFAFLPCNLHSQQIVEYDLTIAYGWVNFTGKQVRAMTVNGQIPGPPIEVTEGDSLVIRVHNKMDVETSLHWHGILLPNREDGVSYLTTPPIKPTKTHEFKFRVKQSGTHWYHSHTGLQEQRGVYAPFVIHAKDGPKYQVDREYIVVLSDWIDEDPGSVYRNLRKGSHYYLLKKGAMPSIVGAVKAGAVGEMLRQWWVRMPPMDIADVAYDAFLINGKEESYLPAAPGEIIRLRVINASASTYFYLDFANRPMQIISADGVDVVPVNQDRILIAIAETYDILIRILNVPGAYELRATAQDGSGSASLFLGSGDRIRAVEVPKPNIYVMEHDHASMGHDMEHGAMDHSQHETMDHGSHDMPEMDHSMHQKEATPSHDHHKMKMDAAPGDSMDHSQHEMMDHGSHEMPEMDHSMHEKAATPLHDHHEMKMDAAPGDSMDHSQHEMMDHSAHDMHSMGPGQQETGDHHQMHNMINDNVLGQQHLSHNGHQMMNHGASSGATNNNHKMMNGHSGSGNGSMNGLSDLPDKMKPALSHGAMQDYRPMPPYEMLVSPESTKLDPDRPLREIYLNVTGDMERYIWSFNNKTLRESDFIRIKRGENVRITLDNKTMMHHPIHLHGHYFRVLTSKGDYSPLKHTVDVPPMGKRVLEFYANAEKDWLFHCHVLYHMSAGMTRIFHYEGTEVDPDILEWRKKKPTLFKADPVFTWADVALLSQMTEGQLTAANTRNSFMAMWEHSWEDPDHFEIQTVFDRYFNRFFTVFAGANFRHEGVRGILGFNYLLPMLIDSKIWVDSKRDVRLQFERGIHLLSRLEFHGNLEYDTEDLWEWHVSSEVVLSRYLSWYGQYHSEFGIGAGFMLRY